MIEISLTHQNKIFSTHDPVEELEILLKLKKKYRSSVDEFYKLSNS
jgi:hypothetical protein